MSGNRLVAAAARIGAGVAVYAATDSRWLAFAAWPALMSVDYAGRPPKATV